MFVLGVTQWESDPRMPPNINYLRALNSAHRDTIPRTTNRHDEATVVNKQDEPVIAGEKLYLKFKIKEVKLKNTTVDLAKINAAGIVRTWKEKQI